MRPQSTWFRKPSERTVWATPNRLPLAQAVTQSCENKTSSRKSWSPCQIGVCPKKNDNGARCYRATIPRSNSCQNPYLSQAGLWLQPTHWSSGGPPNPDCSVRVSREFVSSCQALRKRVPRAPGFGNHLRGQFGPPPTNCHWPRQ